LTNCSKRYPIEQQRYQDSVGRLLPHRIGQILEEMGYKVEIDALQGNGVDLKVFDTDKTLLLVAEILNWSPYSRLSEKRKCWIVNNLTAYDCTKLLIYTTMEDEGILSNLQNDGISLLKIGSQLLPKAFLKHYYQKGQIENRIADSSEAKETIRHKIADHLISNNIHFEVAVVLDLPQAPT
jgi:hypothetical protein